MKLKLCSVECTFCEKIISLVRFSYTEKPLQDLSNKVRHTYDLHLLMKLDTIKDIVSSNSFDSMLLQVALDDDKAIPNGCTNTQKKALIFSETAIVWTTIKKTYTGSKFKELITEKEQPLEENNIFETLLFLSERVGKIEWNIK